MNTTQLPSVAHLQRLPLSALEKLAQTASGQATRRWLILGRCFLVLGQNGRVEQCGCSGTAQYAGLLGIKKRDAAECKRVAGCLEQLPLLRRAAELGQVGWGALCEVTKKATPETEARWLNLALNYTLAIVERLVEVTPYGQEPCDPDLAPSLVPEESWLHLKVPAYVAVMFQRAVRQLSLQARTPVSAAICQELLLAEFLAGLRASREAVEKLRTQARKDVAAQRQRGTSRQMLLEEEGSPGTVREVSLEPEHDVSATQSDDGPESNDSESQFAAHPNQIGSSRQNDHLVPLHDDPPAPPLAALAGRAAICPSQPSLRLFVPDTDTDWENPRLRFSEEARLATPAQRLEMLRRDGYCCAAPGCPNKLWLDLHHVVFYCEGGVTLPENLIVVCTRCHRNIHKGRLKVTGQAPDGLRWTTRRGHELDRPFTLEPELDDDEADEDQSSGPQVDDLH